MEESIFDFLKLSKKDKNLYDLCINVEEKILERSYVEAIHIACRDIATTITHDVASISSSNGDMDWDRFLKETKDNERLIIDFLSRNQLINNNTAHNLHTLRKLGNCNAHYKRKATSPEKCKCNNFEPNLKFAKYAHKYTYKVVSWFFKKYRVPDLYEPYKEKEYEYNILSSLEKHDDEVNKFIHCIEEGRTLEMAFNISGLTPSLYNDWNVKANNGNGLYAPFLRRYNEALKIQKEKLLSFQSNIGPIMDFLSYLKSGLSNEESCIKAEISQDELNCWIEKAEDGIIFYTDFLKQYNSAKSYAENKKELFIKNSKNGSLDEIFTWIKEGRDLEECCKLHDFTIDDIEYWVQNGKEIELYGDFSKKYYETYKSSDIDSIIDEEED